MAEPYTYGQHPLTVTPEYERFFNAFASMSKNNAVNPRYWGDMQLQNLMKEGDYVGAISRYNRLYEGDAEVELAPHFGEQSSLFGEDGLLSGDTLKGIAAVGQAIGSVMGAWNANKAYGLAKDQFNFQKDFATKNLANQIASYNTALTDRMQARAAMETGNKDAYNDLINQRKLA